VITLNSPTPIFLEAGVQAYIEPGATALDNVDGDVSSRVIVTGFVNTALAGFYTISYNATDTHGNAAATVTRIVTVRDTIAPVITVPSSPVVITTATAPAQVNFSAQVSVFDAGYPSTTATCTPSSGSSFAFGDTTVKCNATDLASNKAIEETFTVRVRYLYDIKLILSKGVTKAGSTMPLDWQYLNWNTGLAVNSSSIVPKILWKKADSSCKAIDSASRGEDSGSSYFRYSSSNMTWQYSWQTPAEKGNYILTVSPPGTGMGTNASTCVNLK
jgi:hypothetical protein